MGSFRRSSAAFVTTALRHGARLLLGVLLVACDGSDVLDVWASGEGILRVTATASGASPLAGHYVEWMADGARSAVLPQGVTQLRLTPGRHSLRVEPAFNCVVERPDTEVEIRVGEVSDIQIAASCVGVGHVRAAVSVTGAEVPRYVTIDLSGAAPPLGPQSLRVATNDTTWLTLLAGDWRGVVRESALCLGAPAVNFSVSASGTVDIRLELACPGDKGTLRVSTTIVGTYVLRDLILSIDGMCTFDEDWGPTGCHSVPPGGGSIYLLPGSHTVEIYSLPSGCTVVGQHPATVTIVRGETVDVSFTVTCT